MNIGVCGTGTIASWISSILNQLGNENIVLYGCATSPGFDCSEFQKKFGWKKKYADFEALMSDPAVDVVYIALPNHLHYSMCKQAIEHGKNVVCEKPFAVNDRLAREIIELAENKKVFLSEALWPSFLPIRAMAKEEIASGIIGTVTEGKIVMLDNVMFMDRIKSLEMGGGSLLDGGPYTLGCMTDYFGLDIRSIKEEVRKLDTGVDAEDNITVEYSDGRKVRIRQTIDIPREQHEDYAEIIGTEGKIVFQGVANPSACRIEDTSGRVIRELKIPEQIHNQGMPPVSGYEHEWIAFEKAIREGKTECDEVTHDKTYTIAKLMTEARRQAGITYPFE